MRQVTIHTETTALAAFLKWAEMAASGGDAKRLIQQGMVRVNGVVEKRRARKLTPGDVVEVAGRRVGVSRRK